jgi:hypothetical protein
MEAMPSLRQHESTAATPHPREDRFGRPEDRDAVAPPPESAPDAVDDASDASFPASDPPSWWAGR